jgi:outer membrane protein
MKTSCAFLTLLVVALGAPSTFAQSSEQERIDAITREAVRQFAEARTASAEQTRPTNPPEPGVRIELTLDDAVKRALDRNLDIAVERLGPQTYDYALASLNANYRPTFNTNLGLRNQSSFERTTTAGSSSANGLLTTETLTGNYGLTQNVKWGGGSFAVAWNNNRIEQSSLVVTRNPALNSNLNLAYVQPLLRNFRTDGTRTQLKITQINQEMSETALRATVTRTVVNVRNAYWDLVFAMQAAEVADGSLELATKLVEDNQARVEVGTLAPLDVVQAQAEQATRRQAVATAQAAIRVAELSLKRLIVNGTDDPYWVSTIEPVDRPTFSTESLDLAGAVRKALATRTDIEQSRKQVQSNNLSIRNLSDQRLPSLDLTTSYAAAGIGGTQFLRPSGQFAGAPTQVIPGGFSDALSTLFHQTAPTWNFAVSLSYPIGSSTADANLARARVQQQQTIAQQRQLELQIATEVTSAAVQIEANRERVQAAQAARDLAEKRLAAEQSRFEVGLSTNFFVVQAQRDLRDAQNAELRTLLDYRRSQVEFERVQEIPAVGGGGLLITTIQPGGGQASRANAGGGNFGGGGGGN